MVVQEGRAKEKYEQDGSMSYELHLRTQEARLLYLALSYHLGRPGSEVDPQTLRQQEHGLLEVAQHLHPQLNQAVATISLTPHQLVRLGQAMLGTINELKAYPLLKAQARGTPGPYSLVPGFDDLLATLFPEVQEDENASLDLAEAMMMLRRRLEPALHKASGALAAEQGAAEHEKPRRPWEFWRR